MAGTIQAPEKLAIQNLEAYQSNAIRTRQRLNVFFHVVHHGVEIVFFKEDIRQANTVFFVKAFRCGFGGWHVYAHFLMQEWNEFVGLNPGNECSACILFEHDLVADRLAIELHKIQCAGGHARSSSALQRNNRDAMSLMRQLQPCKLAETKNMLSTRERKELLGSAHPLWWQGIV
jgi:hypothetical protein